MAGQKKNSQSVSDTGIKAMLDGIRERNQRSQLARKARTPEVAVFWLVNGKLLLDGIPWTEAEHIADFVNHPHSHEQLWRTYQRNGLVPCEMEYEEPPRGRATTVVQQGCGYALPHIP